MKDLKPIRTILNPKFYEAGFKAGKQEAEKLYREHFVGAPVGRPSGDTMGGSGPALQRFLMLKSDAIAQLSQKEIETIFKIKEELSKLPPEKQREAAKEVMRQERKRQQEQKERDKKDNEVRSYAEKLRAASNDRVELVKIVRVDKSMFPLLRDAARNDKLLIMSSPLENVFTKHAEIAKNYEKELFTQAQVFLMQHDWAAVLDKADLESSFRLPYEVCAFEFQITDRRVIALCVQDEDIVKCSLSALTPHGWLVHDFGFEADTVIRDYVEDPTERDHTVLMTYVMKQVRACCIVLDADVAVSEVVREPQSSKPKSGAYVRPPSNYHVVSLVKRNRPPRLETSEPTGRRVRLHFRRGHWRHFEDHRTWIKWMLVGDPDLGFIDKHYKL